MMKIKYFPLSKIYIKIKRRLRSSNNFISIEQTNWTPSPSSIKRICKRSSKTKSRRIRRFEAALRRNWRPVDASARSRIWRRRRKRLWQLRRFIHLEKIHNNFLVIGDKIELLITIERLKN